MQLKAGDTVRYLNAVGGGVVVRVQGDIAYVDEDGFETPVLARECVVVGPTTKFNNPIPAPKKTQTPPAPAKAKTDAPAPTALPVIETTTGNTLNMVLGFEASDLKALSRSTFDAYFVNDSNYYIYVSIATRATDAAEWTPRYDGLIEPNIQEFLFEVEPAMLADMDRVAVQYMAFKRGKAFAAKQPGLVELKVDTTKFAKLHCFRPNAYFDVPVIAFDIVANDRQNEPEPAINPGYAARKMMERTAPAHEQKKVSKPAARPDVIEVDLHIDNLVDTTAGLSPADMLNLQIDRFSRVMDENLRRPGQKIVFIHGKGEGVLRQAIMKELNHRYKGHDVQDASFREYGFGATQVTIRATAGVQNRRRK